MKEKELHLEGNKTTPPKWKEYHPIYATNVITEISRKPKASKSLYQQIKVEEAKNDVDSHMM